MKPINSILIHEADNVATAIVDLDKGEIGRYSCKRGIVEVVVAEKIPQFHKFSVQDVPRDGWVRKYGEVIGQATRDIVKGAHVHVHNITSPEK
jgi:altronate dehydratase